MTLHAQKSNAQCCSSVSVDLKLECSQPEGGLCPGAQPSVKIVTVQGPKAMKRNANE